MCGNKCDVCAQGTGECQQCAAGYSISDNGFDCECTEGFDNGRECVIEEIECPINCLECSASGFCTECGSNYKVSQNGDCHCPTGTDNGKGCVGQEFDSECEDYEFYDG